MAIRQDSQIEAIDAAGQRVRYQTEGLPIPGGNSTVVWLAKRLPDATEEGDEGNADEVRRVALKVAIGVEWTGKLAEEAVRLSELQNRSIECMDATGSAYRIVRVRSGPKPMTVCNDDRKSTALIELEYLDGKTLQDWLDEQTSGSRSAEAILADTLRIGEETAEALVQIEACGGGMFHRDIKPANLMVTSQGIRLFDFNVSRNFLDSTMTHVGTPGYIAPEVATGHYDARADLWSVGVTLWEALHGRRMDRHVDLQAVEGRLAPNWPAKSADAFAGIDTGPVAALLADLVTDVDHRVKTAADLLRRLRALRPRPERPVDPLAELDLVELLFELNPGGILSVVTDTAEKVPNQAVQDFLRERTQITDSLEDWLAGEIRWAATGSASAPTLFVLAGNAGDGKSHLLARLLRKRFAGHTQILERIRYIADATHVLDPTALWSDRLDDFFAPFADVPGRSDNRVHLIAMNTGMVVKFFDRPEGDRFARLRSELQRQLGLRRPVANEPAAPWRVQVLNLDLRNLLSPGDEEPSFFERMLDKLRLDNDEGIVAAKSAGCNDCSALGQCPVAFNLRALAMPAPRATLLEILRRATLESDVHLSPRAGWGFIYRMLTGGQERYTTGGTPERPCDRIRRAVDGQEGGWLREGHFSEILFEQTREAGAIWEALGKLDPAFAPVRQLDELHTRLSVKTELDNDKEEVALLGGEGHELAGIALNALMAMPAPNERRGRRRDAAVRRRALFHPGTARAWLDQEGAQDYTDLLDAYYAHSRGPDQTDAAQKAALLALRQMVQDVFLSGHGRRIGATDFLRVSQPNFRRKNDLLVRVERSALNPHFSIKEMLRVDPHCEAHEGRLPLLQLLGYRPTHLTLEVARVRLAVDLPLYQFLTRVKAGQKPSGRDLAQFQALVFIGNRLGNLLARGELHIWDPDAQQLHRLAADDFGVIHVERVAGG